MASHEKRYDHAWFTQKIEACTSLDQVEELLDELSENHFHQYAVSGWTAVCVDGGGPLPNLIGSLNELVIAYDSTEFVYADLYSDTKQINRESIAEHLAETEEGN